MIHALHRVTDFHVIGPHRLRVSFRDGIVRDIDFQPVLAGSAPCDGGASACVGSRLHPEPSDSAASRLRRSARRVCWPRAAECDRSAGLEGARTPGYTFGMKTAVSIPDDVFEDAERLASRLQTSRSKLYARALAEFVARHDDDRVTALMDQAVLEAGGKGDPFLDAAAKQVVQRAEW